AAPFWLFAALVLAPAAVAAVVWRRLQGTRPTDEQAALKIGALTGAGFAATAWLAALVGRITVLGAAGRMTGGWFGYAPQTIAHFGPGQSGVLVVLRPNPMAVLGLGLLWGVVGGLGAAFLWASRHQAGWTIGGARPRPSPGGQEEGGGEPPLEEPPPEAGKP